MPITKCNVFHSKRDSCSFGGAGLGVFPNSQEIVDGSVGEVCFGLPLRAVTMQVCEPPVLIK